MDMQLTNEKTEKTLENLQKEARKQALWEEQVKFFHSIQGYEQKQIVKKTEIWTSP